MVGYSNVMGNLTQKHVHLFNRLFPAPPCLKRGGLWMCKLSVISQKRLKIEVKLLLNADSKSCTCAPRRSAQQRMTLSDLEWPFHASRAISTVAELLACGVWLSGQQ